MNQIKLCADNISFTYPKRDIPALQGISFSLYEKEWVTIIGKNGSGKSTLGKIMNGLLLPDEGRLTIDNDLVLSEETVWDIRKKVGMVFQNPDNQFVGTTVIDDIAFGLENIGVSRDVMIERMNTVLAQVGMEEYKDVEPHLLSGGQKQRVAIAGILAVQPSILILDEATSMLDPKGRGEVLDTVQALMKEEKVSVISITHDLEEALYADRVIVLDEGKILLEGTPQKIFKEVVLLQNIGLDVPFAIKLSLALQKKGINLSEGHLTMEGLVNELCELHLKK